jgi:hypothetical protein
MLALSMTVGEGFWLLVDGREDERWEIIEVFLARGFVVRGGPKKIEYEVTQDDEVEIAPGVWLSDGIRRIVGRARVNIQAPQKVMVLRDDLYVERKKKEAKAA